MLILIEYVPSEKNTVPMNILSVQTQISFHFYWFQENGLLWYMETSHFLRINDWVYTQIQAYHTDILLAWGRMGKQKVLCNAVHIALNKM